MNFEQAQQQYAELRQRLQAGQLTAERFAAAAAQLRVQAPDGRWWQIDPSSGQWLYWDGAAWKPASPPLASLAPSIAVGTAGVPPAQGAHVSASGQEGRAPGTAGVPPAGGQVSIASQQSGGPRGVDHALRQIQRRTVDLPTFLREAKRTPLSKRSQGWWDLFAILGGLLSGYLWFVYSSVRGLPTLKTADTATFGRPASWWDLAPALALMAVPVVLFLLRRPLAGLWEWLSRQLEGKPPIIKKLIICSPLIVAVCLYLWPMVDPWIFPRFFQQREGLDCITPLIIMAIPILLVWFRTPIDALLLPFQPLREKIPLAMVVVAPLFVAFILYRVLPLAEHPILWAVPLLLLTIPVIFFCLRSQIAAAAMSVFGSSEKLIPRFVLIGAGLAAPFAVAYIIYLLGQYCPVPFVSGFFVQYPYMRISVVLSTLVSYVILRTPVGSGPMGGMARGAAAGVVGQAARALPTLLWLTSLGILYYHGGLWADDFLTDPFNLNDGLRTPGWAPVIAGTATSVVTVLVNGAEVIRVVIVDPNPPAGGAAGADGAAAGASGGAEGGGKQVNFQVVVNSVDATGARGLELNSSTSPTVFIYAYATKEGASFPPGTGSITFAAGFDQTFVSFSDLGMQNGQRCAQLQLVSPMPTTGKPPESVTVTVNAGQAVDNIPVTIGVRVSPYYLELK